MRSLGIAAALLLVAAAASAQVYYPAKPQVCGPSGCGGCANGRCPTPPAAAAKAVGCGCDKCGCAGGPAGCPQPACKLDLRYREDEGRRYCHLYVEGKHVAKIDEKEFEFVADDGRRWDFTPAKAEAIPTERQPAGQLPPDGISREKFSTDGKEHFTLHGREVDARTAYEAFGDASTLTDDSARPWLTVIGSDADRKQVLADLATNPALSSISSTLRVKAYAPDHRDVAAFAAKGHPTVVLQAANGRVLWRQDEYKDPNQLATDAGAMLAAYDPTKDPGPGKPYPWVVVPPPAPMPPPVNPQPVTPTPKPVDPPAPAPAPTPAPPANTAQGGGILAAIAAAVVGLLLYFRRQQTPPAA
jgi:hypothetical protein